MSNCRSRDHLHGKFGQEGLSPVDPIFQGAAALWPPVDYKVSLISSFKTATITSYLNLAQIRAEGRGGFRLVGNVVYTNLANGL